MTENKSQTEWAKLALLSKPPYDLRRFDNGVSRFYWWPTADADNKQTINTAVGITSLLALSMPASPYLTNWKLDTENWEEKLDDASAFGTILHELYFEWFQNKAIPQELLNQAREFSIRNGGGYDLPEKSVLSFLKFVEDYDVTPLLIEAMLLSPVIGGEQYALSLDLYCELDIEEKTTTKVQDGVFKSGKNKGSPKYKTVETKQVVRKRALVDYKSNFFDKDRKSFFDSHKYQLMAAKRAMQFNYPNEPVDLIGNFSPVGWKTEPNYQIRWWDTSDKDERKFDAYINVGLLEGFFKPKGKIFIPPAFTPDTKSSDFRMLSYSEYVEQELLNSNIESNENS